MPDIRRCFFKLALIVLSLCWVSLGAAQSKPSLSSSDRDAIRAIHESYRRAWLAGDAQGVRNTFTDDAVLLPHHGVQPVVGMEAIKQFWESRIKIGARDHEKDASLLARRTPVRAEGCSQVA